MGTFPSGPKRSGGRGECNAFQSFLLSALLGSSEIRWSQGLRMHVQKHQADLSFGGRSKTSLQNFMLGASFSL